MNESLSVLLPKFIEHLQEKDRSPSTILAYRSDLEQLVDYLSSKKSKSLAEQVRAEDLEGFRDHLLAQKYTPKSTSRKLNAVKTFFRWLKDQGKVREDHSKTVTHPKIEASIPKFLSPLVCHCVCNALVSSASILPAIRHGYPTPCRPSPADKVQSGGKSSGETSPPGW